MKSGMISPSRRSQYRVSRGAHYDEAMRDNRKLIDVDGSRPGLTVEVSQPWLRYEGEGHKAFSAFQRYCELGSARSLTKVAQQLNVSKQALGKWSSRWNWQERVRAYDNWMSKSISERVARRLAEQSDAYSKIASERLNKLTPAEKASLTLQETALCSKVAAELASRERGELAGMSFCEGIPKVVFNIQSIPSRPEGYCYVRISDEPFRWTWIKLEDAPRYARENPDHVVIA